MMHLNNFETIEATEGLPHNVSLSSVKKSSIFTDKEYIELLKEKLKEVAEKFDVDSHPDSFNQYEVFDGKPKDVTAPKQRGTVAEFYVKKVVSIDDLEKKIKASQNDPLQVLQMDFEQALVFVRVIKEGKLLYPDVHYVQSEHDTGRHIAYQYIKEVPYFGDIQELDRAKERRIVGKKALNVGLGLSGIAATAAVLMALISAHNNSEAAALAHDVESLSTYSLSLDNVHHAARILQDGRTVTVRKEALTIISKWADEAVMKPRYLGKTDDTYSGPIFFSRIADKALETESDSALRSDLISFKNQIMIKGSTVIINEFNYYAEIAKSTKGMSSAQAKAMSWEHVLIPTQMLTEGKGTRTDQLKMANNLGAIIYSSSKAIPALRFDYQRSIIPQFPRIQDPSIRTTVEKWVEKI